MDSRVVAREIKREIWPLLRQHGFGEFSTKTAWRFQTHQIHVVNFQSFNSYLAQGVGCTTFSFAVNLGIYFRAIPWAYPIKKGPDPSIQPQEYHCHFRRHMLKGIEQPVLHRKDIWYVESDGSNLLETLADARSILELDGLPWFARFESLEDALRLLRTQEDLPDVAARHGSPARNRMIEYLASLFPKSE